MEIAQNLREYILRIHRIETLIAELTVWLRDSYTDAADIDTVQQSLCHAHESLAVTMALRAEAVVKVRRRVRDEYWRGWFERRGGNHDTDPVFLHRMPSPPGNSSRYRAESAQTLAKSHTVAIADGPL